MATLDSKINKRQVKALADACYSATKGESVKGVLLDMILGPVQAQLDEPSEDFWYVACIALEMDEREVRDFFDAVAGAISDNAWRVARLIKEWPHE